MEYQNTLFLKNGSELIAFFPDSKHIHSDEREAFNCTTGLTFWMSPAKAEAMPRATREEAALSLQSASNLKLRPLNNWPATADDYTLIETSYVFARKDNPSDTLVLSWMNNTNTWVCADLNYRYEYKHERRSPVTEQGAREALKRAISIHEES